MTVERIQCLVPADLATRLERTLRKHGEEEGMEVVVERRRTDRRRGDERRDSLWPVSRSDESPDDRRRVRNAGGRRVGERRATLVPVPAAGELPRRARPYADRLLFVERIELDGDALEDQDTARLIVRWQEGDREVFSELYTRYFDRVFTYLRISLNDTHDAEDAAQQVFIQVMEALGRYELRAVPMRAWLFRIVRNHAISYARKNGRLRVEEPSAMDRRRELNGEQASTDALDWVTDPDVIVLIERLPLTQRQVLMLRYMLDLSFQEVADVLNRSPEAVRQLHYRAIASLRGRLSALNRGATTPSLQVPMRRRRRPTVEAGRNRFLLRPTFVR